MKIKYISIAHPRANGQVKRANGMIIDGLKKRLHDENSKKGGKWIHELPPVCWVLSGCPPRGIPKVVGFGLGCAEIRNSKVQTTQDLDRFRPQYA
jgi:hypothetical protein